MEGDVPNHFNIKMNFPEHMIANIAKGGEGTMELDGGIAQSGEGTKLNILDQIYHIKAWCKTTFAFETNSEPGPYVPVYIHP